MTGVRLIIAFRSGGPWLQGKRSDDSDHHKSIGPCCERYHWATSLILVAMTIILMLTRHGGFFHACTIQDIEFSIYNLHILYKGLYGRFAPESPPVLISDVGISTMCISL